MGIAVLILNLIYMFLCYLSSFFVLFIYKKIKKENRMKSSLFVFLTTMFLILLPFWDIVLSKPIKLYLDTFKMESVIYEYPEKNKNGKVHSLDITNDSDFIFSSYLKDKKGISFHLDMNYKVVQNMDYEIIKNIYQRYYDNVENFIEIESISYDNNKKLDFKNREKTKIERNIRYYLNKKKIENIDKIKARYSIIREINSYYFFKTVNIKFIDNKNNKLLAKGFGYGFPIREESFRYKFLGFVTANDGTPLQMIRGNSNYREIKYKLFNIDEYNQFKD